MRLAFLFFSMLVAAAASAQDWPIQSWTVPDGWKIERLNPKTAMSDQNSEVDAEGLRRFSNRAQIYASVRKKELVPLPSNSSIKVNPGLRRFRRFCRPWTLDLLLQISSEFHPEFPQTVLKINSAVRPADIQKKLFRKYRHGDRWGAAPPDGEFASSHLAGSTVDLAKRGLDAGQQKWVDSFLQKLVAEHRIHLIDESGCWHIMVCRGQCLVQDTPPVFVVVVPAHQQSQIQKMLANQQ